MICYGENFREKGAPVVKCTPEMLDAALDSAHVAEVCGKFKTTWLSYQAGEIGEELYRELIKQYKEHLKPTLPYITPHACEYKDGHRKTENATPSGLAMLDIDGTDPDEMWELVKERIKELGIVMVHRTPSYRGFRIIYKLKEGQSIAESQVWMARELGTTYDTTTKDLARASLLVQRSYVYYINKTELFKERDVTWDVVKGQKTKVNKQTSEPQNLLTSEPLNLLTSEPSEPDTFPPLPYADLVDELVEQLGGLNGEGGRNNMTFLLACNLRYVCEDNPAWIASVLPDTGLEYNEVLQTCRSACSKPSAGMPKAIQRAFRQCEIRAKYNVEDEDTIPMPPPMPTKVPALIKLLTSKVPDSHKGAVAMAIFAPLGAHLHKVKFPYISGEMHEANFMCVFLAPTQGGKNLMEEPLGHIMRDIYEKDAVVEAAIDKWQEENRYKSITKDKKPRPKGVVQYMSTNTTPAAFLKSLKDAEGHHLYTSMKELKELNRLKSNPASRSDTTQFDIILQAFDNGYFSSNKVSPDAIHGKAKVRWNWNASSTIIDVKKYFKGQHTNGVSNRLNFFTTPDAGFGAPMPRQGLYDDAFDEELAPYIQNLVAASGVIECSKATKFAEELVEECRTQDLLRQDMAYHSFYKRGCLLAYLRAMVLYIANGMKWDKAIENFVRWSFDHDMWCKLQYFGEETRRENTDTSEKNTRRGPENKLELLPDIFTRAELIEMAEREKLEINRIPQLINAWKNRSKFIIEVGEKMSKKDLLKQKYAKTELYLQERAKGKFNQL